MHKHRIIEKTVEVNQSTPSAHATTSPIRAQKKTLFTTETTHYFKKDLTKSLMITGLLLAVEIGIYVAQLNGISFNISLPF